MKFIITLLDSQLEQSDHLSGLIVWVTVVLRRAVVDDIDLHFDKLSGSHYQSEVHLQ